MLLKNKYWWRLMLHNNFLSHSVCFIVWTSSWCLTCWSCKNTTQRWQQEKLSTHSCACTRWVNSTEHLSAARCSGGSSWRSTLWKALVTLFQAVTLLFTLTLKNLSKDNLMSNVLSRKAVLVWSVQVLIWLNVLFWQQVVYRTYQ